MKKIFAVSIFALMAAGAANAAVTSQKYVDEAVAGVTSTVTNLTTVVEGKADKSDVEAVQDLLEEAGITGETSLADVLEGKQDVLNAGIAIDSDALANGTISVKVKSGSKITTTDGLDIDLSAYATSTDVDSKIESAIADAIEGDGEIAGAITDAIDEALTSGGAIDEVLADYAKSSDLEDYQTKEEMTVDTIGGGEGEYIKSVSQSEGKISATKGTLLDDVKAAGFYTSDEVDSAITDAITEAIDPEDGLIGEAITGAITDELEDGGLIGEAIDSAIEEATSDMLTKTEAAEEYATKDELDDYVLSAQLGSEVTKLFPACDSNDCVLTIKGGTLGVEVIERGNNE